MSEDKTNEIPRSIQEYSTALVIPDTNVLLKNAYYGISGFDNGNYLVKHKRELDDNYERRKSLAYYYNFFAAIVNALVDPVFKKQAYRDWKGPHSELIKKFIEDVDCKGSDMQIFVQQAARACKLYGICYIVVDNFDSVPEMMEDVLAERKMPYAYIVEPTAVQDVKFDRFGNVTEFVFNEQDNEQYRTIKYTATSFETKDKDGTTRSGEHSLRRAPVIAMRSRITADKKPPSEFNSQVRIALNTFNLCSWLGEILGGQAFSILIYPSKEAQDIVVSVNNALGFDGELSRHAPAFIAPDAAPANTILDVIRLQIQEMYRLSGLSFVTGTKIESSGEAKKWEFERTNQSLATLARICQNTEKQIVGLFCAWLGAANDCKYEVSYPTEFGIVDVKTEIEVAQLITDLGLSKGLSIEVLKKIINVYLPELPADRVDELIKEAEAELNTKKLDTTYKDVTGNEPPPAE